MRKRPFVGNRRMGIRIMSWRSIAQSSARAIADFAIVQLSAVVALLVVGLRLQDQPPMTAEAGIAILRDYYFGVFFPLSVIFPVVHAAFGVYTTTRTYTLEAKVRRAAMSAFIATLTFVFLNFLFTRTSVLPRSSALLFSLLVISATAAARWLKAWIFHSDELARLAAPAAVAALPDPAPSKPDKVLVVGGAGYIGAIVLEKLLARGQHVRLLDRLVYGDQAIAHLLRHPNLEFMPGDCRNIQDVVRAMADVRDVIHLAAIVGDPACSEDDKNALEINYAATRMMIEIAKGHGVERFLFASSCSVYGASDLLMDENSKTVPVSLYGETKLNSEKALLEAKSDKFHPVVLRFATVFGLAPRPRFDLVVNLLTAKAFQEGTITIYNGEQWRPFIHVADIAEAVVMTLSAPLEAISGEILNVGDDRLNYTLGQIADIIKTEFPNTRVEEVENSDRRNYRVSFAKIRERVGFEATRNIEDGVRELKLAFERGLIGNYQNAFYSNILFIKERGKVDSGNEVSSKVMAAFADVPVGN